jgi:hypothetical protein
MKLMVDGDGGFRFAVERDGVLVSLSETERAFLLPPSDDAAPVPAHMTSLYFTRVEEDDESVLSVELV